MKDKQGLTVKSIFFLPTCKGNNFIDVVGSYRKTSNVNHVVRFLSADAAKRLKYVVTNTFAVQQKCPSSGTRPKSK